MNIPPHKLHLCCSHQSKHSQASQQDKAKPNHDMWKRHTSALIVMAKVLWLTATIALWTILAIRSIVTHVANTFL